MRSTFASQKGSGRVGRVGPDSFSSSSDPFEVVGVNSSELFSNEHMDESVDSMACSCKPPEALEDEAMNPGEAILTA